MGGNEVRGKLGKILERILPQEVISEGQVQFN